MLPGASHWTTMVMAVIVAGEEVESLWIKQTGERQSGESLFTLFASLTYAFHYLMTLIK